MMLNRLLSRYVFFDDVTILTFQSVIILFFTPNNFQVVVPKGSLCQLNVKTHVGLPPDAIFNIVIDPDNRRVFKNIQVGDWNMFYMLLWFANNERMK